jgi:phage terminase Nu1 subunit (DNA packaging protein)
MTSPVVDGEVITATEIAELAGVGISAVSQWRKRYASFPQPVLDRPGATLFNRAAVTRWLRSTGRTVNPAVNEPPNPA